MGRPYLSICAFIRACMSVWVFNMVVKCLSGPIPHLPSAQISWHVAKANRHEDGAEGITMQPSMQFVLTLSGVLSSPLILMSSPGFRFTGIQHPNEVPGLGGGSRTTSIQPHKHPHANFTLADRHIFLSRETSDRTSSDVFFIVFLFQTQPPIGWVQIMLNGV